MHAMEFVKGLGIFSPGQQNVKRMADKNKCGNIGWSGMYQHIVQQMQEKGISGEEARHSYKELAS